MLKCLEFVNYKKKQKEVKFNFTSFLRRIKNPTSHIGLHSLLTNCLKDTTIIYFYHKKSKKLFWIFNWKDWDKPATRAEVAIMCMRTYDLVCEKIEK